MSGQNSFLLHRLSVRPQALINNQLVYASTGAQRRLLAPFNQLLDTGLLPSSKNGHPSLSTRERELLHEAAMLMKILSKHLFDERFTGFEDRIRHTMDSLYEGVELSQDSAGVKMALGKAVDGWRAIEKEETLQNECDGDIAWKNGTGDDDGNSQDGELISEEWVSVRGDGFESPATQMRKQLALQFPADSRTIRPKSRQVRHCSSGTEGQEALTPVWSRGDARSVCSPEEGNLTPFREISTPTDFEEELFVAKRVTLTRTLPARCFTPSPSSGSDENDAGVTKDVAFDHSSFQIPGQILMASSDMDMTRRHGRIISGGFSFASMIPPSAREEMDINDGPMAHNCFQARVEKFLSLGAFDKAPGLEGYYCHCNMDGCECWLER